MGEFWLATSSGAAEALAAEHIKRGPRRCTLQRLQSHVALAPEGREANSCCSPVLYKTRNAIERMFCRMKDSVASLPLRQARRPRPGQRHLTAALTWWL
jgi:hypothetical protein